MSIPGLTDTDIEQITAHGIGLEDAGRQMDAYRRPPAHARLDRACTAGDGITLVDIADLDRLLASFEQASRELVITKFVPASGAASRMFRSPLAVRAQGLETREALVAAAARDADAQAVLELGDDIHRFAFGEDLAAVLGADPAAIFTGGGVLQLLDALLGEPGLDYAARPKGLIKFHRNGGGSRTAAEEHLVEAAHYARDADGLCRVHFTVSEEHLEMFEALVAEVTPRLGRTLDVDYRIDFSLQKASTDAVAATPEGGLFRDDDGGLLFRPAGHGALLENLGDLDADIVFVKNIDNVVPDHLKEPTILWKRALGGLLYELRAEVGRHLEAIAEDDCALGSVEAALTFASDKLGVRVPTDVAGVAERLAHAREVLSRPLRVCGMVRNEGEPGGGPFWVESNGTVSKQIVESSQVDPDDASQQECFATGTHFNPVDLVCALRDANGRKYDLQRYVDHETAFIADKSKEGRPLRSFERPGLWNGAMAFWNTVFVDVPPETFNPVKTVNDLLRSAHQPLG
ncbi:MAG: DUF4301 family protein [Candidatus Binatia bacterium]